MLAYYVHHWSPFLIEFTPGVGIRWYGLAYVLGFLCGFLMLCRLARQGYSQLPEAKMGDFVFGLALFGVLLGGRLGYLIFYDFEGVFSDPLRFFRVWEGGMASHGGILGIVAFTFWYARRHHLSWTGLGDNLVVVAPIGIFFGRLANFINGELYGRVTAVPWAMQFPSELLENRALADRAVMACATRVDPGLVTPDAIIEAARTSEPVRAVLAELLTPRHPSQLYAAALEGAFLFLALWLLRTRLRLWEGVVTGAFFILYAAVRIFDEQFREPDVGIAFTLGLTRGQFLSLFLIVIGAAFIAVACRQRRPSPHPA